MADEKGNPFGGPQANKDNATATTLTPPENNENQTQNSGVTDDEAKHLDGAAGPNRTPAFGKRDFEDENVQLTDTDDLSSLKAGAAAHGGATFDLAGFEAAAAVGEEQEGYTQYTSTPISNLRIGAYQFENGVLSLKNEDTSKFEELLGKAAIRTQQVVRKIDRAGGEAVAQRFIETTRSRSNRDVDTSDNAPPAPTPAE